MDPWQHTDSPKDYYRILGVSPSASIGEIKNAYRSLVKKYHPDQFPNQFERLAATTKLQDLNEAYEVLRDPSRRIRYDRYLEAHFAEAALRTSESVYLGHKVLNLLDPIMKLDNPRVVAVSWILGSLVLAIIFIIDTSADWDRLFTIDSVLVTAIGGIFVPSLTCFALVLFAGVLDKLYEIILKPWLQQTPTILVDRLDSLHDKIFSIGWLFIFVCGIYGTYAYDSLFMLLGGGLIGLTVFCGIYALIFPTILILRDSFLILDSSNRFRKKHIFIKLLRVFIGLVILGLLIYYLYPKIIDTLFWNFDGDWERVLVNGIGMIWIYGGLIWLIGYLLGLIIEPMLYLLWSRKTIRHMHDLIEDASVSW